MRVGVHEYVRMRKLSNTLIVGSLIAFYANIYDSQALVYPGSLVFLWYGFYDPWGFQAPLIFFSPLNLDETHFPSVLQVPLKGQKISGWEKHS